MRRYKMIDFSARKLIAARYAENARVADIADEVGVTTAAVYRELKRGESVGDDGRVLLNHSKRPAYNPVIAQQRFQENLRRRGKSVAAAIDGGEAG